MKDWFLLFRPWSYTATIVPFLVGGAFAAAMGPRCYVHAVPRWTFGLLAGLLFQASANLLNTWGDERSGVDAAPGAIRTTPQIHEGKISMRALFVAAMVCFSLAVVIGVALCFYELPPVAYGMRDIPKSGAEWRFCWRLVGLGIIGALGAVNYSTGVKFKYHGLGVPFVSFLMGPLEIFVALAVVAPWIADCVLYFLTQEFSAHVLDVLVGTMVLLAFSAPVALLVGVIMHGNDMRDIPTDRAAGIVTLASRIGPRRAFIYYRFCHICPYVLAAAAAFVGTVCYSIRCLYFLMPCIALPFSIYTIRTAARVFSANPRSPKWRGLERASGLVHFLFGVLYAAAIFLMFSGHGA